MIYALDTNIISYILNGNEHLSAKLSSITKSGNRVIIPLIVYFEARRGLIANHATAKMREFDKLCATLEIPDLTVSDMNKAAAIYAERKSKGKMIDDSDLLIAAQCINCGYTLVTNNIKHFENISGFNIENWME